MGREIRNLSAEEALAQLEAELEPQVGFPEPGEVNERMAAAERDAIDEFVALDEADRENGSGL